MSQPPTRKSTSQRNKSIQLDGNTSLLRNINFQESTDHMLTEEHINRESIIWMLCGFGWLISACYLVAVISWTIMFSVCCIPCGLQLYRLLRFTLHPFSTREFKKQKKKSVIVSLFSSGKLASMSTSEIRAILFSRDKNTLLIHLSNTLWFICFGWWICSIHLSCIIGLSVAGWMTSPWQLLHQTFVNLSQRHRVLLPITARPFGVFLRY